MTTIEARHLIAGRWTGEPTLERRNPARADDIVSVAAVADQATVTRAIDAAAAAQPAWTATPAPARGAILLRGASILEGRAEGVALDLTREEGKTLREARGEVDRAVAILRFFGSEGWRLGGHTFPATASAETHIYTRREPLGVVALITPWNFPIAIPAWKSAPALIAGNSVILKPASLTPASAVHLIAALVEAGIPDGVITLLLGSGSAVGDPLVDDPRVAAISFTGSVGTGAAIYERVARRRPRVQLEMGGKNALVVLDDADATSAARIASAGGFGLTGQACTATSRVICTRGIVEDFVEAFVAESQRYAPRDGQDPASLMGPVISADRLASNLEFLEGARAGGARIVAGDQPADGLLEVPAIVADVDVQDRLAQEEVFGPVVAVLTVDGLGEAIDAVNATRYGLTAGIVTADLAAAHRFANGVRAGVIKVNLPTTGLDLNVPFGGVGDSSTNTFREQGSSAVDFYSWTKSVYQGLPPWT